jgi:hypothetical protein
MKTASATCSPAAGSCPGTACRDVLLSTGLLSLLLSVPLLLLLLLLLLWSCCQQLFPVVGLLEMATWDAPTPLPLPLAILLLLALLPSGLPLLLTPLLPSLLLPWLPLLLPLLSPPLALPPLPLLRLLLLLLCWVQSMLDAGDAPPK